MICHCKIEACPAHFGCVYEYRGISWILEFELHFCSFITVHFGIHVEYIHGIRKKLCYPPLQMTNSARKMTKYHCLLWRRCTGWCIVISLFWKECLSWCIVLVRFRILCRFLDKHCQKCLSQPSENQRFHPSIEWPFIVPLSRNIVAILGISQH